jgi:hypothetical protein
LISGEPPIAAPSRENVVKSQSTAGRNEYITGCGQLPYEILEAPIRDLPSLSNSDEGIEGAHLPQAAQMAMSEVQEGQDAKAEVTVTA